MLYPETASDFLLREGNIKKYNLIRYLGMSQKTCRIISTITQPASVSSLY